MLWFFSFQNLKAVREHCDAICAVIIIFYGNNILSFQVGQDVFDGFTVHPKMPWQRHDYVRNFNDVIVSISAFFGEDVEDKF